MSPVKYTPLSSSDAHPWKNTKKQKNMDMIKPLDPTTNEQKTEQNNMLNHMDATSKSQ